MNKFQRVKVTAIKKQTLYLSVNAFSTEVLIGDTNFTSPTGATRRSSRSCSAKGVPSFLSYCKTLSIAPVKRSTD